MMQIEALKHLKMEKSDYKRGRINKVYGTVKYYNQQKCYGFIGTSDGKEYFFHISGLNKNYGGKPNADDNV